jgi:hypothetical protein
MLTDDERRQGAQLLFDAERQRKVIPQLSKTFPGIEIVDAYRIQDLWAELKMALGVGVAGHKIGLTSRAMQMARLRPHLRRRHLQRRRSDSRWSVPQAASRSGTGFRYGRRPRRAGQAHL